MILNFTRRLSSQCTRFHCGFFRCPFSQKTLSCRHQTAEDAKLDHLLTEKRLKLDKTPHKEILKVLELCSRSEFRRIESLNRFLDSCCRSGVFFRPSLGAFSSYEIINLLTSLTHLNRRSQERRKGFLSGSRGILQGLSFHITPMLKEGKFTTCQISKLVYSLGILSFQDGPLNKQIITLIQDHTFLKTFSPPDLSCLVYGLAQLGLTDFYTREKLTKVILEDVGLGTFRDQDLASLLYSAVKLKWKNAQFDRKLATEATHWMRIGSYNSKTLSSVCYSLGLIPESSRPDLSSLITHLKKDRILSGLDSQALVHISHGLTKTGLKDDEFWIHLGQEIGKNRRIKKFTEQGLATLVFTFGPILSSADVWIRLLEETSRPYRLPTFQNSSLMNIFIGLKSCSCRNYPVFVKLLGEAVKPRRLGAMSLKQLTALVLCIGHYPLSPPAFIKSVFFEIFHCSRRLQLDPQIITLTIYSLGRLKAKLMSKRDVSLFLERGLESGLILKEFTSQGLSCLVFGLGELRFSYKSPVLKALVQRVLTLGLNKFSDFELCNIAFGLGRCGFSSSRTTGVLLNELLQKERLKEMDITDLSTLILSLSLHQLQDQIAVALVMDRVLDPETFKDITVNEISRILFGLSKLQYSNFSQVEILMKRLLSQCPTEQELVLHVLNSLGEMGYKNEQIWRDVLAQLAPQKMDSMSLEGLSNLLSSLQKVQIEDQEFKEAIIKRLLHPNCLHLLKSIGLIKVLEALVEFKASQDQDKRIGVVIKELLKRRRIKYLNKQDMLKIVASLHKSQYLHGSNPDSECILNSILNFNKGLVFKWITNEELLSLIKVVQYLNFANLGRFIHALESELYRLERRDGITMSDMITAMSILKNAKHKSSVSSLHRVPLANQS